MEFNVLSLFSGCGGLDLGVANSERDRISANLEDTKFNFVWSNDLMTHACKTIAKNWDHEITEDPTQELDGENLVYNGDVREVNFEQIIDTDIDLIMGGFPCKDFSILRGDDNRGGVQVERGKLYLEFVRSLADLQPKIFVAENVKGLISANDGKAYDRIMSDFKNLNQNWEDIEEEYEKKKGDIKTHKGKEIEGYTILHSKVIDFSHHGVPQGRERLAIIGLRNDLAEKLKEKTGKSAEEWKEKIENDLKETDSLSDYPLSVMETFEGVQLLELDEEYEEVMKEYSPFIDKLDSERAIEYREEIWTKYTFDIWEDYLWRNNIKGSLKEFIGETPKDKVKEKHEEILEELGYLNEPLDEKKFRDGSNELMRETQPVSERLNHIPPDENHRMVKDTEHHVSGMMSNIYRRTHPLQPSPTIISSGGGGTWGYHYELERGKLTNRERARIQSFPDDFLFHGKNGEVRKQIGNAVPPLGAKRIGENILPILKEFNEH